MGKKELRERVAELEKALDSSAEKVAEVQADLQLAMQEKEKMHQLLKRLRQQNSRLLAQIKKGEKSVKAKVLVPLLYLYLVVVERGSNSSGTFPYLKR